MKKLLYLFAIAVIAASCNSATKPDAMKADDSKSSTEAIKMKTQRFYDEVLNAHNAAAVDSFCTADFVDHNPDPGKTGKGSEELKAALNEFFVAYPDLHVKTNMMVAEGDKVVAHVTMTGTNSGMMAGMPATNKQVNIDGIDMMIIKDGMATERWGFFDTMKMMQQLGMMPEPGAKPEAAKKK